MQKVAGANFTKEVHNANGSLHVYHVQSKEGREGFMWHLHSGPLSSPSYVFKRSMFFYITK